MLHRGEKLFGVALIGVMCYTVLIMKVLHPVEARICSMGRLSANLGIDEAPFLDDLAVF